MSVSTFHIVGAGVAGLAAAVRAVERGAKVRLYEAAPQAGGRCRTVLAADGFSHDNGTHVLLGANPRALDFLRRIDALERWIEPEPDGLPVFDLRNGELRHVGVSPFSWLRADRRPEGVGLADIPRLARLVAPLPDRAIGSIFAGRPILDSFIDPLTVAVLNTPVETASARRLGRALRQVARRGGGRLFVAREGLGPDLVAPALDWLAARGVEIETGARLRALEVREGRVVGLVFAGRSVVVGEGEKVVLALPPQEIARLIPQVKVPDQFEPIVNAHFAIHHEPPSTPLPCHPRRREAPGRGSSRDADEALPTVEAGMNLTAGSPSPAPQERLRPGMTRTGEAGGGGREFTPRFIGMRGALSQWLLVRHDHVSVTVSAAGSSVDEHPDALIARIWNEIAPAMRAAGLNVHRGEGSRVVKEKRATIRQEAGPDRRLPVSPYANLALAGDWISDLPATIESATISGEDSVATLLAERKP
ncbi:MAG TPA: FAD-dependent oxidoreductase [Saliniramus sp.]|nr:FAD-dependent oxidoreductase [Saliniramus sp.]